MDPLAANEIVRHLIFERTTYGFMSLKTGAQGSPAFITQRRWDEIESGWLGGAGPLAYEPNVVIGAFERVESEFGRDWMEADRTTGGVRSMGLGPTLGIVVTGSLLASLDGVLGGAALVTGLCERDEDATSEAIAIHLLRAQPDAEIEYEPSIMVGGRSRKPDLRAKSCASLWVYAEVAKPNDSDIKQSSNAAMRNLAEQVKELSGSFAAEVFLRRRPSHDEIASIKARLRSLSQVQGSAEVDLPDGLGKLFLNLTEPGKVILDDHGEGYRPGIGTAVVVVKDGEHRHISVRIAYSDDRAEQFLRREARQLPNDAPA